MISCFRPVVARTAPLSESVTERERPVAPTRNRAIGVLNHSAGRRLSRLKSQRSRDAHGVIGPQRASRLKNSAKRVFSEEGVQRVRVPLAKFSRLLLFLGVKRVLPQPRAVLFDFQLFATRFASQGVVVVAGFLTDEVDYFEFLFAFSHGCRLSQEKNRPRGEPISVFRQDFSLAKPCGPCKARFFGLRCGGFAGKPCFFPDQSQSGRAVRKTQDARDGPVAFLEPTFCNPGRNRAGGATRKHGWGTPCLSRPTDSAGSESLLIKAFPRSCWARNGKSPRDDHSNNLGRI